MTNRHYHVIDDDISRTRLREELRPGHLHQRPGTFERSDDAVRNMFARLNPGGHLLISCPYSERQYVPNVYKLPGSSYGQDFAYITQLLAGERGRLVTEERGEIVEQEFWRFFEGEFWTVGRQTIPPAWVGPGEPHQLTCLLMRKKE